MSHQSVILAFSTMIFLSGCQLSAPGERALSNDQCFTPSCETVCPAGETCSSDTPNGLFFRGASLFDDIFGGAPRATAEGGTQEFIVHRDSEGKQAFAPFDAEASSPLEIAELAAPRVTLRGAAAGSGFLRILDVDTGALHDRIELEVLPIASVRLTETPMSFFDPEAAGKFDLALFKGSSVRLGVALQSADGAGLVDESMTVTITGDAKEEVAAVPEWDKRILTVGAAGTVSASVVAGAGAPVSVTMPIVDVLDDIVAVKNTVSADLAKPLPVGSGRNVCFRGVSNGRAVAGLSGWVMSGEGSIEVNYAAEACGVVKALAAGKATIFVEVGGAKKSFPVTMAVAAKRDEAPAEKASGEEIVGLTPGERARH
ncbi:hypothetical protein [Polyangium sp. 15x6]|uniref:hypothetical protein n=1 Tax=Polyangium sp. 15x6 TaxID=3042687 RepID=UPI00249AB103|nr:hypothetical protein [Polyangium sp. 15x6]MDI3284034.1 hypothetical protein [Polyangium sp. 15x6]